MIFYCFKNSFPKSFQEESRLKVLRLFLETGANPNATATVVDVFHIYNVIAQYFNGFTRHSYWMLFQTLLDAGSNLNSVNSDGETVFDVLRERLFHYCGSPYYINLDSFPPLPLRQLCAQVIRYHQIVPIEHQLPPVLQRFVYYDSTFLGNAVISYFNFIVFKFVFRLPFSQDNIQCSLMLENVIFSARVVTWHSWHTRKSGEAAVIIIIIFTGLFCLEMFKLFSMKYKTN